MTPFQLSFITDANEVTGAVLTPGMNEAVAVNAGAAGAADDIGAAGTLGFSLAFTQIPCA